MRRAGRKARLALYQHKLKEIHVMTRKINNKRHRAVICWSTDDIRDIRPDLNEDQAWTVLQQCEQVIRCEVEVMAYIESIAEALYPTADDS